MAAPKPMTFGVIVGNRGFFPGSPGQERPRGNDCCAGRRRHEGHCSEPEQESKYGAVETLRRSAPLRRPVQEACEEIDGIIVTLPNFGEERGIADAMRLADLNVPVLVQATPDDPGKMTIAFRRDSFCGKMSACNNLKQYGIPYSLTTLHTEAPVVREFAEGPGMVRGSLPRRRRASRICASARSARVRRRSTRSATARAFSKSNGISVETARSLRDPRPHRSHEGQRRCGAGQAGRHQEVCHHRRAFPTKR